MSETSLRSIVLVGNPNTGKTSLFNKLTGMTQKVGNYPGVTVEKKVGKLQIGQEKFQVTDLPGTYSINPSSQDEKVVLSFVQEELKSPKTQIFIYVAEVSNLRRNLLFFTQLRDLGLPIVLAINMVDQMTAKKISIDIEKLEEELATKVIPISVKKGTGLDDLKKFVGTFVGGTRKPQDNELYDWVTSYTADHDDLDLLTIRSNSVRRMKRINELINYIVKKQPSKFDNLRANLDKVFLHKIFGPIVFFAILLLIFQGVYSWSAYPMEGIDLLFANLSSWTKEVLPKGTFTNLIAEGLIPGIGGVAIFIPQIAILFMFIAFLEESGYMSRVVYIADKVMRKFGLSGKSVIPLISGTACAIPAVMAARNIQNEKEKLITILVTPFMTCSARLPVYLMIIALVIPSTYYFGVNLQAITLFVLYVLGFLAAILSAYVLNKFMKLKSKDAFIVEMPEYRMPSAKNVFLEVFNKTKSFVFDAGKIIVALSIVLWFLASHGFSDEFNNAEQLVTEQYQGQDLSEDEFKTKITGFKVEHSMIGSAGKFIEPVIAPLGYDWKIGVAVLSSFAAREVFIGSLATIYNVGNEEFDSIQNRMRKEKRADGSAVYDLPTGISILLFYVFAMQCISTLAIVKSETGSWKWPILQLVFMSSIAYLAAMAAYQILS
ncbi:ferrous iron transport protein B [Parvicella tangerina]|uniref:Ferrous iron transport protein B n=1 Tax=Parvicella tangerina TaxID=2829795 RepID=A0A916NG68_9FLAO|nr:ferrous iron transport protein B [Parvicella tangerina]CAG5079256.1 Fe(2+) transporter FeoB [Parvicella tangerina]